MGTGNKSTPKYQQRSNGLNVSSKDLNKISDDELNKLDKQFKDSINIVSDKLPKLVSSPSASNPSGTQSKEYYDARNKLTELRNSHSKVIQEIARRKSEKAKKDNSETKKSFVNSYGEATKRDISTATYDRLQKKLGKQMMRFIGG